MPANLTLTNTGATKLAAGGLNLKHIAVGSVDGSTLNTSDTALGSEEHRAQISGRVPGLGVVSVSALIPSNVGGFTIREIGVFDSEGDLVAFGDFPDFYKPTEADSNIPVQSLKISVTVIVANTSQITASIPANLAAAYADFSNVPDESLSRAQLSTAVQNDLEKITKLNIDYEKRAKLSDRIAAGQIVGYNGNADPHPILTDQSGNVLLGIDKNTGELVALIKGISQDANFPLNSYLPPALANIDAPQYIGSGNIHPFIVDQSGKILLGINKTTGKLDGAPFDPYDTLISTLQTTVDALQNAGVNLADLKTALADLSAATYTGSGNIHPFLVDQSGKILLGINKTTGKLKGAPLEDSEADAHHSANAIKAPFRKPTTKGIIHFLVYGQSNAVGADAVPPISTTQPYFNLTFDTGPKATLAGLGENPGMNSFKPLVEDSNHGDFYSNEGETVCSGAANHATRLATLENGFNWQTDFQILASTAGYSGHNIAELSKGHANGWFQNLLNHVARAKAISETLGKPYHVPAVCWIQGEADAQEQTTKSAYLSSLEKLHSDIDNEIKNITGQRETVHMLAAQISPDSTTYSDIALAQWQAAKENDWFHLVIPTFIFEGSPSYGRHYRNTSILWMGSYFGRAFKQIAIEGRAPDFFTPKAAILDGTTIIIHFDVPKPPLVLDNINLPAITDNGFKVFDDFGPIQINSVSTLDQSKIIIELDSSPALNPVVRYALDYTDPASLLINAGAGNLRDSESDFFNYAAQEIQLFNVCPAFELPLLTIG